MLSLRLSRGEYLVSTCTSSSPRGEKHSSSPRGGEEGERFSPSSPRGGEEPAVPSLPEGGLPGKSKGGCVAWLCLSSESSQATEVL
jgi:hypothetical protein